MYTLIGKGISKAMDSEPISQYLKFQLSRKITNLYKNYLVLLEDLQYPPYNSLKEEDYKRIRKKILDLGNNVLREMEEDLDKVNISLKHE